MKKKTYKIKGMHCASCAMVIESDLEDAGVKASCSYAKQVLDIEYDENRVKENVIKEVVTKAGYILQSD
jgi:P-type Cu+ transporter